MLQVLLKSSFVEMAEKQKEVARVIVYKYPELKVYLTQNMA